MRGVSGRAPVRSLLVQRGGEGEGREGGGLLVFVLLAQLEVLTQESLQDLCGRCARV